MLRSPISTTRASTILQVRRARGPTKSKEQAEKRAAQPITKAASNIKTTTTKNTMETMPITKSSRLSKREAVNTKRRRPEKRTRPSTRKISKREAERPRIRRRRCPDSWLRAPVTENNKRRPTQRRGLRRIRRPRSRRTCLRFGSEGFVQSVYVLNNIHLEIICY